MTKTLIAALVVAGLVTFGGSARAGQGEDVKLTDLMGAATSVEERTIIRVAAGRLADLETPGRPEPTYRELLEATRPYFRPALEAIAERVGNRKEVATSK